MAARITDGARQGAATRLFSLPHGSVVKVLWDVHRSGGRFLVADNSRPAQVNLIENWFEELKKNVPVTRK